MNQTDARQPTQASQTRTALIVGASRGLGWGLAREYAARGWRVLATVRDLTQRTPLHELAEQNKHIRIEQLDTTVQAHIEALQKRLAGESIDLLFVNAGIANDPHETIEAVATEEFVRVLVTNALAPMRVVAAMLDLVKADGKVAVMSSGLGSVAGNDSGGWEVYRSSKAALNTLMRSFVARHHADARTFYAIAPGWVRTDMGTSDAPLDIDTSISGVADAIERRAGTRGLVYVNYQNDILPW